MRKATRLEINHQAGTELHIQGGNELYEAGGKEVINQTKVKAVSPEMDSSQWAKVWEDWKPAMVYAVQVSMHYPVGIISHGG